MKNLPYKVAIEMPKGGAVNMSKDHLQAQAADSIRRNHGLRGEAIYNWANEKCINLVKCGHILSKPNNGLVEDILNGTDNSLY